MVVFVITAKAFGVDNYDTSIAAKLLGRESCNMPAGLLQPALCRFKLMLLHLPLCKLLLQRLRLQVVRPVNTSCC
jgi:hypothetical protein